MTTQSNPSPFSTDIKSENIPAAPQQSPQVNEFEMRTMKEDIAKLQSGGIIEEKKITSTSSNPSTPVSPIKTTEQKEFNSAEISSEKIAPFPEKSVVPEENNKEKMVEVPTNNNSNKNSSGTKIVIAFISILIIAIIGSGAYYFALINKKNTKPEVIIENENPVSEVTTPAVTEETPDPTTTKEEPEIIKYSEDKPNYLPIDINNLDASEIKASIIKISDDLKMTSMKSPYEFIIVDLNNNPISFPIFATAAKINFSQTLLASLGNNFSFYIYNDNSKIRTGLNIEIKNKEALLKELVTQEKTFITDASFLFLDDAAELNNNAFASSTYGNYSIRYSNATSTNDISIDYSIIDSKFVIGTSKNTERAIIDKLSATQTTANTDQSDCSELATNLLSCTPYTCESSITKLEIKGLQGDKCIYIQYLPNNYKMNCNLTKDMQEKFVLSLKEFQATGNASFSVSSDFSETTVANEINSKPSGLQEALDSGQCIVDNK